MSVWRAVIDPMRGPHLSVDGQVVANFYDPSVLPLVVAAPKLLEAVKLRVRSHDIDSGLCRKCECLGCHSDRALIAEAERK